MKFSDYLMQKRIERAKQIIASSANVKIYEVANKVGLGNSTAYFGQVFASIRVCCLVSFGTV